MDFEIEAKNSISWVLRRIMKLLELSANKEVVEFEIFEQKSGAPSVEDQRKIIEMVSSDGLLQILGRYIPGDISHNFAIEGVLGLKPTKFRLKILDKPKLRALLEKIDITTKIVEIKDCRLDEAGRYLEINGDPVITFKSKRKGNSTPQESALFKILFHLWDFRQEKKGEKLIQKGNIVSLENLRRQGGAKTDGAVYQQISRINKLFNKHGLPIQIRGSSGKYILRIEKS